MAFLSNENTFSGVCILASSIKVVSVIHDVFHTFMALLYAFNVCCPHADTLFGRALMEWLLQIN